MRLKIAVPLVVLLPLLAILIGVAFADIEAPPPPPPPAPHSPGIDVAWLQARVEANFELNRVTQLRTWNGRQTVTYHAPYLRGRTQYPERLPRLLHGAWRLYWWLEEPLNVSYPHQWLWDSCAHAITLSWFDVELAKAEIRSLLYAQRDDGFIPHMIFNPEKMHWLSRVLQWVYPTSVHSPYVQTPALAEAVERVYLRSGDLDFVVEMLPKLKRFYYDYLDQRRALDGDGLPIIIYSYETGKDRSPEYEPVYGGSIAGPVWRGPMAEVMLNHRLLGFDENRVFASGRFLVKDLLFSSVYARNLASLGRLCELAEEDAALFFGMARETEKSILEKMYDPESGLFYSLDARQGRDEKLRVSTVSTFLPLILDSIEPDQVERLVEDYLLNPEEYWTNYPVPAQPVHAFGEPLDDAIWRGPQTWVYTNWYIVEGLRKQAARFPEHEDEYNSIADEITLKTYELVVREGFREYYDSRSGAGRRAYDFCPSTLVLDMVYNMTAEKPCFSAAP